MVSAAFDYISAGGNRHPSAADWDQQSGVLAFGADQNVALWKPLGIDGRGIFDILSGHSDQVNAVKFAQGVADGTGRLLSGSANGELCIWERISDGDLSNRWTLLSRLEAHTGATNAIATPLDRELFVTGGADSTVKIWKFTAGGREAVAVCTIVLKPQYIPLSIAIGNLLVQDETNSIFLAIGGTRNFVQIYTVSNVTGEAPAHSLQATMIGHESWITSLALKGVGEGGQGPDDDLWLASASQDKTVRLWRISRFCYNGAKDQAKEELVFEQSLSAKIHTIRCGSATFSITFEALLVGHDDWIYTASWDPQLGARRLLTVSADNSLIIWEPDPSSGIWFGNTRLGEISAQKGATSATGSTGGFWIGLWSPNSDAVTCLGKSGSWRLWQYDENCLYWVQKSGLTGHAKVVTDLSWSKRGEYLLSTSSDQTTRLHAEWQTCKSRSWHEFARPQIHGYDLNCVQSLSATRFVSGAEEKLLRVFDQPKNVAQMLDRLCRIGSLSDTEAMPEAANIPVLGLSNKAIAQDAADEVNGDHENNISGVAVSMAYDSEEPPSEDYLARHTLWPEHEKLYGHGHEISAVAASHSGSIIATACKASSTEHAVVRLYDTQDWHEIRPPLAAHSLTVARLQFHTKNDQLLSVGRDRQWALFNPSKRGSQINTDKHAVETYSLLTANPKGHSRMILDVAWWTAGKVPLFATAGRDKTVKIWAPLNSNDHDFICRTSVTRMAPVTAVDIYNDSEEDRVCMAIGEETGTLSCHILSVASLQHGSQKQVEPLKSVEMGEKFCPSKAVTRLAWRPGGFHQQGGETSHQLAIASADSSLRILSINWKHLMAHESKVA